jgi:hypothetical protein
VQLYRVIKKSLCTWWLQYRKLQVMFKVSPASLQTFIDTPNCVPEDRVQYRTVHILNVFCDGHLQIINCVGIVRIHWVFHQVNRHILIHLYIFFLLITFTYFHLQISPKRPYMPSITNGALDINNTHEFLASSLASDWTWAMHYQLSVSMKVVLKFFCNFHLYTLQTNYRTGCVKKEATLPI